LKKVLFLLTILSIIATSPFLITRAELEAGNQTYEIVSPYDQIELLLKHDVPVYEKLRGKVQSISVEPVTIADLDEQQLIDVLEEQELANADGLQDESGLYIKLNNGMDEKWINRIEQAYEGLIKEVPQLEKTLDAPVLFIKGYDERHITTSERTITNPILTTPLGFDFDVIEEHESLGFDTVFRIGNNINEMNLFVLDDMLKLNENYGYNKLLFSGNEVLELENPKVKEKILQLMDRGFSVLPIEFSPQKGYPAYAHLFENQQVWLHSINPFNGRGGEVDRAARAVNERNIRVIFLHISSLSQIEKSVGNVENAFEKSVKIANDIQYAIDHQKFANFKAGISSSYPELEQPRLMALASVIGVASFIGLAALRFSKSMSILSLIGFGAIGLLYVLTGMTVVAQALALAVGIIAATYAVVSVENFKGNIILQYVKSLAIGLAGAWLIVSLLYGDAFLTRVEEFRGVKLLFVAPIVLVGLHFIRHSYKQLAMEPVRYYQLAIGAVLLIGAAVYVMRSGNNPAFGASAIEMIVRTVLEDTLGIRPRTKEFLIGFPLFILALHLIKKGEKWAHYLLIGASVGFVSMVNTFTHLHIPLYISVIRTIYGAVIGLIIGLLLIVAYEAFVKKVWPLIKARL
jgi:hypothetical protein